MKKQVVDLNCGNIISDEVGKALIRRLKIQVNEAMKVKNKKLEFTVKKQNTELRRLRALTKEIEDVKRAKAYIHTACQKLTRTITRIEQLKKKQIGSVISDENYSCNYYDRVRKEAAAIRAVKKMAGVK